MATKLGTLTLDLVAKIGNFTQGMRQASSSAEREMQRASSSVNVMNGMLGKLAATAGAVFSINQIKNYADSYTGIVNQLKLVTSGQAELNTAMNDTYKIAQATASSWGAVNTVYSKYMSNAKVLNLTQAETARLTEVTSKAVAVSGSTTEAAAGALFQFGQALDGNILRAEEYNSLVDGAGGLLNAMAKGLNVTRGELRQMMLDGKLSGQVITEALLKAGDSVDELYSKTDTTIAASFNLITTEVTKMVGEFDSATGASKTFVEGITLLSQNMDALVDVTMVAGAYWAGTYIPVLVKGTQATIADTASKVTGTLASRAKAIADYEVAKSNLAATAAMVRGMGVTNAQTAAMMTNARAAYQQAAASRAAAVAGTGALGLLGGPVGIGVTLAAVAAGYLLMRDSTEESTKSLRENNESVDDAIKKYKELDEVQRRAQLVSEKNTLQDLAKEYDEVNSKLITATYSFSRHNDMTSEQSKQVNALIAEYKKTGDIDQFSGKINALNFISQTSKDRFNTLGGSVKDAGNEFKNQKSFVDQMAPAVKGVGDQAKQTAGEVANLSEELKKLLSNNAETIYKNDFMNAMVSKAVDPKLAEYIYEMRKAAGILNTTKTLSQEQLNSVREKWQSEKNLNKTLEERTKIEERSKKAIEAQGNAMKVNALVASNAAKANYAALESAKGLPKGLLSAVNMTESPNSNTARSGAGARGAFQFMPKTAERFNVDVNSVNSSAKGAAEYLDRLLKMFEGNLENALRAYNWGEGNMQNYLKYGSGMKNGQKGYFADKPMPRETREYSGKVMGYMGGSSGVSFTESYSFDDWLKEQEQFAIEREKREKEIAEKQKELALEVATYREKVNSELADKLEEIDKAGFDSAKTAELKAEYKKRAEIDIQVSEAAHSDKLAGYSDYLKSEEQLLNESFARRQRDLKLDLSLTAEQYTELSLALEKQRNKELQQAKWRALEARQAMADQIKSLASGSEDVFARASMAPQDYAKWSLENSRNNSQLGLQNDLGSVQRDIASSDAYSTDEERYQALLDAHEAYLSQKTALDIEYAQQVKDLETRQYEDTMQMYGALLSQAGSVWGDMTQMVKDSAGEQSGAYKAMFLMQQMFAIGSALVSTHLAAAQVMADPTALTMAQKTMYSSLILGMGYANVGLIAGQTIAGMAHDGIDNIPREGTWLLDKGERVVDSRTNADLKNMIANNNGGNGGAPNVNVYTLPGETADVSWNDGRLDVRIRKITRETINGDANDPNSGFSKAMKRNFTVSTKR